MTEAHARHISGAYKEKPTNPTEPGSHRYNLLAQARVLGRPLVAVGASVVNHCFGFIFILFSEDDVCVTNGFGGWLSKPFLDTATSNLVVGGCRCRRVGCSSWCFCFSESGWVSLVCGAGMPWYATSTLP